MCCSRNALATSAMFALAPEDQECHFEKNKQTINPRDCLRISFPGGWRFRAGGGGGDRPEKYCDSNDLPSS